MKSHTTCNQYRDRLSPEQTLYQINSRPCSRPYLMVAAKFSCEPPSQTYTGGTPTSEADPVLGPPSVSSNGTLISLEFGPEIFCCMLENIDMELGVD